MKINNIFAIIIIFTITIILFANVSVVQATGGVGGALSDVIQDEVLQAAGYTGEDVSGWSFYLSPKIPDDIMGKIGWIIAALRNVSIIITILVITLLGIRFMLGSVEEKAEYRKSFTTIIIGVVFITLTFSIVSAIFNAATNIIK